MRRGTTPSYVLVAEGYDLGDFRIILSLRRAGDRVDLEGDRLSVEVVEDDPVRTEITFTLTQEETLLLGRDNPSREGYCDVQIRAVNESGTAVASDIEQLDVRPILKDGVISYA